MTVLFAVEEKIVNGFITLSIISNYRFWSLEIEMKRQNP